LVPSVEDLDFGVLPKGAQHAITFWLHNPGKASVEISRVKTSCECLEVTLSQECIAPGSKVLASARVDFSDDRDFTGRLRLEAIGRAAQQPADAFKIAVTVTVD
jgi:hypothetical protein